MTAVFYLEYQIGVLAPTADGGAALSYDRRWLETPAAFPLSGSARLGAEPRDVTAWLGGLHPDGAAAFLSGALKGAAFPGGLAFGKPAANPLAGAPLSEPAAEADALTAWRAGAADAAAGFQGLRDPLGALRIPVAEHGATALLWATAEREGYSGILENRFLTQALARKCGLPAPQYARRDVGGRRLLLWRREDVAVGAGGEAVPLHVETLRQALGARPSGGAFARRSPDETRLDVIEALNAAGRLLSAEGRLALLDEFIFAVLVNDVRFGPDTVVLRLSGGPAATPGAFRTSAAPWDRGDLTLGFGLADVRLRADQIVGRTWRALAERARLNGTFTLRRVEELATRVLEGLEGAFDEATAATITGEAAAFRQPILDFFRRRISDHTQQVAANAAR